jgi:hypothetical protein
MFWRRSFKIRLTERASVIHYEEAHRKMLVYSEMLHGGEGDYGYDIVIYERSITSWLPPHDKEPVTTEERAVIKKNIEAWFKKGWFKPWRINWQA